MLSFIKNYLFPDRNASLIQYSRDGNLQAIKRDYPQTEDAEEICISLAYQYDHYDIVEFFLDKKFYLIYRLSLGDDEEKIKKFFLYFWENAHASHHGNEMIINHILCGLCEEPAKLKTIEFILNFIQNSEEIKDNYLNSPNSLTNPLKIACRTKNSPLVALLFAHGIEPDNNNLSIDDMLFLLNPIIKNLHRK